MKTLEDSDSQRLKDKNYRSATDGSKGLCSLPFDILEQICRYCTSTDLSKLSQASRPMYLIAMPIMYSDFRPTHFIDILRLKAATQDGLGPTGIDRHVTAEDVIMGIKSIFFPGEFWGSGYLCREGCLSEKAHKKAHSYYSEEMSRALADVVRHMRNLRSINLRSSSYLVKSERFWQALSHLFIEELVVDITCSWLCRSDLTFTPFCNLKTLDISLHTNSSERSILRSFESDNLGLLLQSASTLQDLSLYNLDLDSSHCGVRVIDSIGHLSALRKLQMGGCSSTAQSILALLCSLSNLEHFIYDNFNQWYSLDHSGHMKPSKEVNLMPSLKRIDVSEHSLMVAILQRSQVQSVGKLDCFQKLSRGNISYLSDDLQTFSNLEQLELQLDKESLRDANRQNLMAAFAKIPPSLKRLAIHALRDSSDAVQLLHYKPEKDCLKSIRHLVESERLILPGKCIQYANPPQEFDKDGKRQGSAYKAKDVGSRATDVAVGIDLPSLEYVFFGKTEGDDMFCQKGIDAHRRYIVRVTGSPITQAKKGRSSLRTVHKEKSGFYSHLMHRPERGVIVKAELVSAVCDCITCIERQERIGWTDEGNLHRKYHI